MKTIKFLMLALVATMFLTSCTENYSNGERIDDRRKAQEKAAHEESKQLASMQSGFKMQIGLLSKTNAHSKERLELINSINKEYGTTLKNLADESKFQSQLTSTLEGYLKQKRIEFQVKKNEAYFESLMAKENDARKDIRKEGIKITEEEINSITKLSTEKERAAKMEAILLAKNPDRNLSRMAPEVKALVDLRVEQERVVESTFKLENAKNKLSVTSNSVVNATNREKESYKTLADEADKEFSVDNDVNDPKVIATLDSADTEGWKVKIKYHETFGKNWFSNRGETNYFVKEVEVLDKYPMGSVFGNSNSNKGGKVVDTVYVVIVPKEKVIK